MNKPTLTTHTSISFWDGVQNTQQSAAHAAEHRLSDDCVFNTRMYIKRDTHTVSLPDARVLIQNHGSVSILLQPVGVRIPANDFLYAVLKQGDYELQLDTKEDHKFAVTTITE